MKFKAITMEGDVCDSDGGMQGGTRRGMGRLITACQKLRPLNSERKAILEKLRELKAQMDHYNKYNTVSSPLILHSERNS